MAEIIGLVLPFFGMILLGYIVARITRQPVEALGWLNTFIIYIALPALFFKLVAKTPIEQLTRVDFILADIGATYLVFTLIFAVGLWLRRATIGEATIQGLAAAYGNIGYMGPGLALLAFGEHKGYGLALIDELMAAYTGGSTPTLRNRWSQGPKEEKRTCTFYFQCIRADALDCGDFAMGRSQAENVKAVLSHSVLPAAAAFASAPLQPPSTSEGM